MVLACAVSAFAGLFGATRERPRVPPADSAGVVREAREAEVAFERTRRMYLPVAPSRGGGSCDERIGRLCYWYDRGALDSAPPEPRQIAAARDGLIRTLARSAAILPGDDWIIGQEVRYLLEAGRFTDAQAAARACRATRWWCEALEGLALHGAADFGGAEQAFREVARDMPPEVRCRWADVGPLLDGSLRRRYERLSCAARAGFEARLWWLAWPLYSRPGNDRRTEHWARATLAHLLERATTPYALPWGDDLREVTIRYGWPVRWTRGAWEPGVTDPGITGYDAEPALSFVPHARAFAAPESSEVRDWATDERWPRERYAPPYAASLSPLVPAISVLRRGDSSVVVASYDLSRDARFMLARLDAALVLARDESTTAVVVERPGAPPAGVLVATAPWSVRLASLEVNAPAHRRLARARWGVPSPAAARGELSVSDLVLFDPPDSLPRTLADVLPYARGPISVRSDGRLGLFWEVYGLAREGEAVQTTVSVTPAAGGWLRHVTERVGLAHRRTGLELTWQEMLAPAGGVAGRALALELSHLAPGRYAIALAVAVRGTTARSRSRDIEVMAR